MAKVFIDANENFTSANSNTRVFGSSGIERVTLQSGIATNTCDQNIERVDLPGAQASYLFQQTGNILNIYSGSTLILSAPLQNDADGTQFGFTDKLVSATIAFDSAQGKPVMKLGGGVVSSTSPSAVGASSVAATTPTTQANALSLKNSTADTTSGSSNPGVIGITDGQKWGASTLTYSFNTQIPAEYTSQPELTNNWTPLNATEKSAAINVFSKLSEIISIKFSETSGQAGDIRFNVVTMDSDTAGFAYTPSTGIGGDVWLANANHSSSSYYTGTNYGGFVLLHEIGHAMGLMHSFESPVFPVEKDTTGYTVMSYTLEHNIVPVFTVSGNSVGTSFNPAAFGTGYSLFDIAALQALYGPNMQTRPGNNTYTVSSHNNEYLTIWDAGGTDTINAAAATGACTVDLRSGSRSTIDLWTLAEQKAATIASLAQKGFHNDDFVAGIYSGAHSSGFYTGMNNLVIANNVIIENVTTGSAGDSIYDNYVDNVIGTGAGNDNIFLGMGGYDTIDGGSGVDTLFIKVNRSEVQQERQTDGSLLLVTSTFAAKLIGVESVICGDGALEMMA